MEKKNQPPITEMEGQQMFLLELQGITIQLLSPNTPINELAGIGMEILNQVQSTPTPETKPTKQMEGVPYTD